MPEERPIGLMEIAKRTFSDFSSDEGMLRAAALSYSSVFALPPLLILLIVVAGVVWTPQAVQSALESQFADLVGGDGAKMVREMVTSTQRLHGIIPTLAGIVGLFLGATGAFLSLQGALNRVWNVIPDPSRGGVRGFLKKRMLSFGMALAVAFLLVVSLAMTTAVSAVGKHFLGGATIVVELINNVMNTLALGILFAAMFKVLPDAEVTWRDVWLGGFVTAVLLVIGKVVIGIYLGHSRPGNPFGAASALAVIFVWVYYAGALILLGAEFTQQWASAHGRQIRPEVGAVKIEHHETVVDRR
jgi:membrane protein